MEAATRDGFIIMVILKIINIIILIVIIIILISSQVNIKSVGRTRAKGQKVETATASSFRLGVGGRIFLQLERVSISYSQHRQSSIWPVSKLDKKDNL